jgi:prevent-host-death family protein
MTPRPSATWPVADAKARLSEVIDRAIDAGPQIITRHGRPTAVLVSTDEWNRKTHRRGNLDEFFAASTLRGSNLEIPRSSDRGPIDGR